MLMLAIMGVSLLMVETETMFRMNLNNRLQREGFRIFSAGRSVEVKRLMKRKKIDVALLDLSSLKLEGLRILRMIKKSNPLTEVITINNAESLTLSIDAMKLGAFDDLLIPFDIHTMIRRIREAGQQTKINIRQRQSLLKRYQQVMMAVTFAEAGEPETAKKFIENANRSNDGKGENNGQG
jgi:DNA-binding NtrC family response regulator